MKLLVGTWAPIDDEFNCPNGIMQRDHIELRFPPRSSQKAALQLLLILLMNCSLLHPVVGQTHQNVKDKYEKATVYFNGEHLIKEGQKVKMKYFKLELVRYEDSRLAYHSHLKHDRRAWIWLGTGIASLIAANTIDFRNSQEIAYGISIASLIPFILNKNKGDHHLHRSIWYYNRDLLFDQKRPF